MKKLFFAALLAIFAVMPSTAQNYKKSSYYNHHTGKLDYSLLGFEDVYFGFRVGPSFTTILSDEKNFDCDFKTGLNVGVAAGFGLSENIPLFIETGLYYNEKGGKKDLGNGSIKYRLNYLELPIAFKYQHPINDNFSIQPFLGAYLACGVGGKIKDYSTQKVENAFTTDFNRFDAGLKLGCGAQYDLVYVELNYDLGLANILDHDFNSCRNSALSINVGINF